MTVGPLRPWDGRCVKPPPPRRNLEDSLRMTLAIADEGGSWSLCRGRGIRGGLVLAAAGVAGCWQQAKLRRGPAGRPRHRPKIWGSHTGSVVEVRELPLPNRPHQAPGRPLRAVDGSQRSTKRHTFANKVGRRNEVAQRMRSRSGGGR